MNFVKQFQEGQSGMSMGLSTGIPPLDRAMNGIQRKTSIGLCAAPKVGKTTLADFAFVLSPFLEAIKAGTLDNVEWIYFSYEIDRISKEFKFAAFFMYQEFGIFNFQFEGKTYLMSQDYLMGKLTYEPEPGKKAIVPVQPDHVEKLKWIYRNRIVPLFGEYNEKGVRLSQGKIEFIEDADNPTGMYKFLMRHASQNGTFIKEKYQTHDEQGRIVNKERIVGYQPNNPIKFTIVVTDHCRKLKKERGFTMKENIDKWLEYTTEIRNRCSYTFINIMHSNRGLGNVDRLKYAGEFVFPTADDVKDSGNLAEESTILMTLFNPNDEKYNLTKHFGVELKGLPNYRSLHITESRYTECPVHIQTNMYGGVNAFEKLFNLST